MAKITDDPFNGRALKLMQVGLQHEIRHAIKREYVEEKVAEFRAQLEREVDPFIEKITVGRISTLRRDMDHALEIHAHINRPEVKGGGA